MKQILLSFLFSLFLTVGFSQMNYSDTCYNCGNSYSVNTSSLFASADRQLAVYPNPATDFIMLKNSVGVREVKIFNLIGRQVKSFDSIAKGNTYPVADLPNGMYLVQLINNQGDVMITHRMNKR